VKGRNEPCAIGCIAHVLTEIHNEKVRDARNSGDIDEATRQVSIEELSESVWRNTIELFRLEGLEPMRIPTMEDDGNGNENVDKGRKSESKKELNAASEEWTAL
jgi:hypothetical protein